MSVQPFQMVNRAGIRALLVSNTPSFRSSYHPLHFSTHECGRLRRQYDTGSVKALQGVALNGIPPLQVHA